MHFNTPFYSAIVNQGADFTLAFVIEDGVILTPQHFFRAYIRKNYRDVNPTAVFNITTNVTLNEVVMKLSNVQTAGMAPGKYLYDVEMVSPDGTVTRILEGRLIIRPEVTK